MARETEIVSKIIHELKYTHSCFAIKLAGSVFQMAGLPDSLIIKNGIHLWIEYKVTDAELRGVQSSVHKQLAKQDVHVYVVRFMESNYWLVDEFYQLRFRVFREGVELLLNLLLELEHNKKKGINVPMVTETTSYTSED